MSSLVRDDLLQRVLLSPAGDGCDELHILSGYASAPFALFHAMELRDHLHREVSVRLNIGMTGEGGIDLASHNALVQATKALTGGWLQVRYATAGMADHTKLYLWRKNGVPETAWFGSANYSASGFGLTTARRESMTRVDAAGAWGVLQSATEGFIGADSADVFARVQVYEVTSIEQRQRLHEPTPLSHRSIAGRPSVSLPLVQTTKRPGEVHNAGAGLNWGQRGSRRRSEAYVPVPAKVARSGFFPMRGVPFAVHADDGQTLFLTVAQDGDKALQSVPDNAEIGLWFRRQLGIDADALVKTVDLTRFGSTHVTFSALDDGSYFMDFSRQ